MAVKKTGKDLVKWDEELAKLAEQTYSGIKEGGTGMKFMSFSGGRMSINGEPVDGDNVNCVIIGWVYHNTLYTGKYNPKNPSIPSCYSFGRDQDSLEPYEASEDPQNDVCNGCPLNEFGSAENGRAKACKNGYRLLIISPDDLDDPENADVIVVPVPPRSMKFFSTLCGRLKNKRLPLWSQVVNISREPDSEDQFHVKFEEQEMVESKYFKYLRDSFEENCERLVFAYQKREAPKGNSKPAKFSKRGR